ncbi:MAG: sigma-70 family RNA polymerase sigma factor [Sedimentisphaerales bacterium]|nr:sigma-70 family RNA polymerase sigma factor [Sedimentisphaerales bacterium]
MTNDPGQINRNDESLIGIVLGGNRSAFGTIVERHWNMVMALALSKVGEVAEAEDVAQESFLKAYSNLHRLRDRSRFIGWLAKIALQECSNVVRRDIRRRTGLGSGKADSEVLDTIPACSSNPGLNRSQIRFVRRSVYKLPEKFRKLIIMRFVTGLSSVEIARQLGKRPGTVRVWLHRAYKILRDELAPVIEEIKS